jgi:antitoxin (DNA-binding transcriptional repressor) of toxin-antitoxin stability system
MKQGTEIIGVRQLRAHLSAYLRRVSRGEIITIGDRRRQPLAQIVAVKRSAEDEVLDRLAARGAITRARGKPPLPRPLKPRPGSPLLSDVVIEQRS